MSLINYLYIDDEKEADAIRDGLNDTGIIKVDLIEPASFEKQAARLKDDMLIQYKGLILDLRLDDNPKSQAKYTAPSLAQALRFEAGINSDLAMEFPIILCSTDKKIQESYAHENTSHDLFDYIFKKDEAPDYKKIAAKLKSLAKGYSFIKQNLDELDNIIKRKIGELDNRIFSKFLGENVTFSIHDLASFIKKELIEQPGPLINEKILAARLGVDIEKSEGWTDLLGYFSTPIKYTGVFAEAWERWWSDLLLNKFKELTGQRLPALTAVERVQLLIEHTKINKLVAATPLPRAISNNFWTICEYYQVPLDPLEAVKEYTNKEPSPWQEYRYLSIDAALERKGKIHISEKERLERIKEQLESEENDEHSA